MASRTGLGTAYLVLAGAVVVMLVSIFALLQPLVGSTQSLREENTRQAQHLAEREEFLRTLDSKIAALAAQAMHEQQLNVVLPAAEENKDVLRIIHQAQIASGGTVIGISNSSAGAQSALNARRARGEASVLPANIAPLAFEIEFTGSYQQLRVFLRELQRSPRLLDIMSLQIQRNAEVLDSITAKFTAQFYRYAESQD